MGPIQWNSQIILQALATLINLLLINNLFDNSLLFEIVITLLLMLGIGRAVTKDEDMEGQLVQTVLAFLIAAVFFRIFLYIQKRIHKEVFMEMKQRS